MLLATTVLAILEGQAKRCTKCGEWKGLERFSRCAKVRTGLKSQCKSCHNEVSSRSRKQYLARPEVQMRRKQQSSEWRAANPEKSRQYKKKTYSKHRDSMLAKNKQYREANRDSIALARKARRIAQPDLFRERNKRYYEKLSPTEKKLRGKAWRDRHLEDVLVYGRLLHRQRCEALEDTYIKARLRNTEGVPAAEATPEIIALKREFLTTKRLVRKLTSTVTENDHE